MGRKKLLIGGIGNIFLGDDAFGCEVIKALDTEQWDESVDVIDFGIRGFDLAYALMDGYESAILIDAMPGNGASGSIYVMEPDDIELDASNASFEAHGIDPVKALQMVKALGGDPCKIYIVGCKPEYTGAEGEGFMGLSPAVEASLPKAAEVVRSLAARLVNDQRAAIAS